MVGPSGHAALFASMQEAPSEYGMIPFWFWNDDLTHAELARQLEAFRRGGLGGVVIHPRTGLSRRIGYLTDTYFDHVRRVVEACARLGMKVILYDEGGYPSGSACGQVVASNPAFAARSLNLVKKSIQGPQLTYWRPSLGRLLDARVVCVVLARTQHGVIDPASLTLLPTDERDLARIEVGAGEWLVLACIDAPSGGTIRGVFAEHEDQTATAPPAGDLMNPKAVAKFIELTHDAYAAHIGDHFGSTVVAMFTDEPNPLGRGARRDARPYTPGFETWLASRLGQGDIRTWLPALWLDYGPGTEPFRAGYAQGVHDRVAETFYAAQSAWCEKHGLALTGHPADSNDMSGLAAFQWPGQDMVWRWVVPGDGTALEGEHSVAPKAAASAARVAGRDRNGSELLGAYGWELTLDEAKWLLDWHLARGTNLFMPHALFYSVREGRAFESEPDLGLHNVWWPHFQHLAHYTRRMSWLLTGCEHVCDVAVLSSGNNLAWQAARHLFEHQIDFLYLDDATLARSEVDGRHLRVGGQRFALVVVDGRVRLSDKSKERLAAFQQAGGRVAQFREPAQLLATAREASQRAVYAEVPVPSLRLMHIRKSGLEIAALYNEGESEVQTTLRTRLAGAAEWWDPLRSTRTVATPIEPGRFTLTLPRRESRLLVFDPAPTTSPPAPMSPTSSGGGSGFAGALQPSEPWQVVFEDGSPAPAAAFADWTAVRSLERYSGTLCYRTSVHLSSKPDRVELDLGRVGDAATVWVNGAEVGVLMWSPYRLAIPGSLWRAGRNSVEIRVTNSAANAYQGSLRPSGLMGPVRFACYTSAPWAQPGAPAARWEAPSNE